ncbi:DUF4190 domain-containing protein [Actinospica robiniae]|uniref:DUF4190 domain-containing protein n=1 Tax=Actinospica robiniae TaxID=304901 RepID=UPI00040A6CC3|nr:DUF4190 domain-containing protein [Actinospica robiniae]
MSDQWGNAPQEPQPTGSLPQYSGGYAYPGDGGLGGYPEISGPPRTSKLAISSLVLGIVSLPAIAIGIGPLLALVGLILGIIGIVGARRKNLKRGIGIAGIILSAVGLIAGTLLLVAAANAANSCKSVDRNDNAAYTQCVKDHLKL